MCYVYMLNFFSKFKIASFFYYFRNSFEVSEYHILEQNWCKNAELAGKEELLKQL